MIMVASLPRLSQIHRIGISLGLVFSSLGLTYGPFLDNAQTIVVVSGSELQEPLEALEPVFEEAYPHWQVELKFQGSQDIVDRYLKDENDFEPTLLIPASGEILSELEQQWRSTNNNDPFYKTPQAVSKTLLVAVSWSERGAVIFPQDQFNWSRLTTVLQDPNQNWQALGAPANWGRFDFVMTDPSRSNSGQQTLGLWARSQLQGQDPTPTNLKSPTVAPLFSLVKRSVYQPPRSTDILLQEFIAKGPNDADVAMVYESIALHRWSQANNQGKPYQVYYLDPTVEVVATGAIVRRDISRGEAKAAQVFLDFLTQPEQQQVFVQHGFRPVNSKVDITTVPDSPWALTIPGARVEAGVQMVPPPDRDTVQAMLELWQQAQ